MSKTEQQRKAEAEARILSDSLKELERYDIVPNYKTPITQLIKEKLQSLDKVASGAETPSITPDGASGTEQQIAPMEFSTPEQPKTPEPPAIQSPASMTGDMDFLARFDTPQAAGSQTTPSIAIPESTRQVSGATMGISPIETESPQQQVDSSSVPAKQESQSTPASDMTPPTTAGSETSNETPAAPQKASDPPQREFDFSGPKSSSDGKSNGQKPEKTHERKRFEAYRDRVREEHENGKSNGQKPEKTHERKRFEAYRDRVREEHENGKASQSGPPIQGSMLEQWKASVAGMQFPTGAQNAFGAPSDGSIPGGGVHESMTSQESMVANMDTAASALMSTFSSLAEIAINLTERMRDIERTLDEASI
jgi:hypothetical protein